MSTATEGSALKLYEINEQIAAILARAAENDGVLSDADLDALTLLEIAFPQKVESVALYVRTLLAQAEVVGSEVDRLAARQKALQREADGLKDYLHRQLLERGESKVAGKLVTIAVQNNAPAVKLSINATDLPPAYQRVIPSKVEPDKTALLEAYKAGEHLPAGVEVVVGSHVRIR
jgi:hypothetical protein